MQRSTVPLAAMPRHTVGATHGNTPSRSSTRRLSPTTHRESESVRTVTDPSNPTDLAFFRYRNATAATPALRLILQSAIMMHLQWEHWEEYSQEFPVKKLEKGRGRAAAGGPVPAQAA